ncbi:hypothetical protein SPF06_03055 [Sinomonas sp. JGH33]|uniref:MacB-like periplasmic core domain-containing protein n=1 Tax=Sinomonas terricola TaxID=3110330 RepID=A0ABU5T223_9MICC|nr:hypothetical protein [Sinomonas sp. JGH33]MEA5453691.1 hypothetical protein [Sinomonas sp. JGH33]
MLIRECLRESWRNIVTGTSRAALLAGLLGLLLAALSIADAAAVNRLDAQAQTYRSSGAAIRAASAPHSINPAACEAIAAVDGITSSGALRDSASLSLGALGGLTVPVYDVTQGLPAVLGASHPESSGAFISSTLASRWNVEPGDTVATDRGPLAIAGLFPYTERDGRDPRFANAVLLPTPATGHFDACLAEVWPSTASRDGLLRGTADGLDGKPGGASVSLLNEAFGRNWQGSSDFEARVTRFAPIAGAVLGAVLGAGATIRRRLEFAAALHTGVGPGRLAVLVGAESAMWTAAAAAGAFAASGAIGVVLFRSTIGPALSTAGLTSAAGMLAAIAGAVAATGAVRESQLFRHFKNRS